MRRLINFTTFNKLFCDMKKISFEGIKQFLNDEEMKNILAGSGDGRTCLMDNCTGTCPSGLTCKRRTITWGCTCK